MQPYERRAAPRRTMSNRQVAAIYVGGILLLLIAFAAGLSVIRQQKVEDPLSDKLLSGEFSDGDAIDVNVTDDGEIVLEKSEERLPEPSV